MTNLAGSLLSVLVRSKNYDTHVARATVAVCYATLACFQLLTLLASLQRFAVSAVDTAVLVFVGLAVFLLTETIVYSKIRTENYRSLFATVLFFSGVVLIFKASHLRW